MVISEHEISILDFKSTSSSCIRFPSDGSTDSRASYTEIEWINYCPDVFRILQDYGKIDFDDYMVSICGHESVRQLISHGKSGSLLYLSHDDRFVIKTINKPEMKVFLDKLPSYYHHVRKYKNTLLTKFYGLHVVKQSSGQKVYFVVMGNLLHSDLYIHKRFDLKASPQSRSIHNESTMEDELDIVFHLDTSTRNQLIAQIKHDCNFLEDMGIIDYSLLLGIHLSSPSPPSPPDSLSKGSCSPAQSLNKGSCSPANPTGSDDGKSVSSQDSGSQGDPDQDLSSVDDLQSPPLVIEPVHKLGVRTPARAVRKNLALLSTGKGKGNNVKLFFEITNILQQYSMVKRVENVFKSLQFDSHQSPGGNPKAYSARFQDFICQTFPENDPCDGFF